MLKFHFLNVGHGDAIVVQYVKDGESKFGVVDSNWVGNMPAVLTKLEDLNAKSLEFISLSHPHADHYSGLGEIVRHFRGAKHYYTYPVDRTPQRLRKLAEKMIEIATGTRDNELSRNTSDFVRFLVSVAKQDDKWDAPVGLLSRLPTSGFHPDVQISTILPPARVKGRHFQEIDRGVFSPNDEKDNDLTLALLFEYAGRKVVLGGDGVASEWSRHWRKLEGAIDADVVKMPHHASKHDCTSETLDFLFGSGKREDAIAIVSADGRSHPHPDVLDALRRRGIKPYCTGLALVCGARNLANLFNDNSMSPAANRMLSQSAKTPASPCQGDIEVEISSNGAIRVSRQLQNLCSYRGDFAALLAT